MGRRPKKFEEMKNQIHEFLFRMMNVEYNLDEGKWDEKSADLTAYREGLFHVIYNKLQNDFTPDERMIVLQMFNKN